MIESVEVGGMPLQTTLNEKKRRVHERVMELITQLKKARVRRPQPGKIVEFFKLGEGTPAKLGIGHRRGCERLLLFLGFTRLTSDAIIRKAIVRGVKECAFGYTSGGAPVLGPDGKYQITPAKVRFDTVVAEDEIDLDSGFVMLLPVATRAVDAGRGCNLELRQRPPRDQAERRPRRNPRPRPTDRPHCKRRLS